MQAYRLPFRPSLRVSCLNHLSCWDPCMDCRVDIELHMPVLLMRDGSSRVRSGFDQSSHSHHQVVHLQDSLLM
ncbi:hypothetical protein M5689_008930 [Euphorbia peplus]|nr:hypothetical protein M5689_008930 [Euphorbia peplus]